MPKLRRLGAIGLWILTAFPDLRAAADPSFALDSEPESSIEQLELLGEWEIERQDSNARDLRWASNDSIFLAFELGGVGERELSDGLPLQRVVVPPRAEEPAIAAILNIAYSASRLQAWAENDIAAWLEVSGSSSAPLTVKKFRGYFDDIDARDDTVALLGYPTVRHFTENEQTYLWLGDLRSGLEQWTPLKTIREDRGKFDSTAGLGTFGMRLGSLRFLANGDLLVVPGFKPGVYRVGRTGKQRGLWSAEELEASLLEALGDGQSETHPEPMRLEAKAPTWESGSKYIRSQRFMIEDVVPVRDKGAIVVRHGGGTSARYYLALLDANPTWFALPIRARESTDRIRVDSSKSARQLVFLVTHRGGPVEGKAKIFLVSSP